MMKRRKLFRTQALRHYAQNRQKDILPRFISPPIFLLLWILLIVMVIAVLFAWQERLPTYTNVSGVVTVQQSSSAIVLLFVPSSSPINIQNGQQIILQVNATGQQINTSVISIDTNIVTPDTARTQYHLTGDSLFAITQPSIVVQANLTSQQTSQVTDGLSVEAQVQTGSRSLLSSLPDLLNSAFGG